jgi:hypothetical protein
LHGDKAALQIDIGRLDAAQGGFRGLSGQGNLIGNLKQVGTDDPPAQLHFP